MKRMIMVLMLMVAANVFAFETQNVDSTFFTNGGYKVEDRSMKVGGKVFVKTTNISITDVVIKFATKRVKNEAMRGHTIIFPALLYLVQIDSGITKNGYVNNNFFDKKDFDRWTEVFMVKYPMNLIYIKDDLKDLKKQDKDERKWRASVSYFGRKLVLGLNIMRNEDVDNVAKLIARSVLVDFVENVNAKDKKSVDAWYKRSIKMFNNLHFKDGNFGDLINTINNSNPQLLR